jgi:hypothetical protein
MRRSVLAVLPQLLRGSAATSAPASYQLSGRLQSLRSYADDANLKVWGGSFASCSPTDSTAVGEVLIDPFPLLLHVRPAEDGSV